MLGGILCTFYFFGILTQNVWNMESYGGLFFNSTGLVLRGKNVLLRNPNEKAD